jgi:molybdopterin converting factor small subunit
MSVIVKVLYFGAAQEIAGVSVEELEAEETQALRSILLDRYPGMKTMPFRMALNGSLLKDHAILKEGDKIAILPPFAGG